MRTATQEQVARRRGVLYVLSGGTLLVGVGGLLLGFAVQGSPESMEAQPLGPGEPFTAPQRALFVGDLVVYGTPPEGARPELDDLGCVVTEGGGPLSVSAARQEDRIVVAGEGLVPLVSFPGREGYSVACTGPAAVAAAPLYVVPGDDSRDLIPLSAFTVASLGCPLGAVGLVMLRASRR